MDVRIGVTQTARELEVELGEVDRDATIAELSRQIAAGDGTITLTDKKGRTVLIPAAKVAYLDIGASNDERKVGFAR